MACPPEIINKRKDFIIDLTCAMRFCYSMGRDEYGDTIQKAITAMRFCYSMGRDEYGDTIQKAITALKTFYGVEYDR